MWAGHVERALIDAVGDALHRELHSPVCLLLTEASLYLGDANFIYSPNPACVTSYAYGLD